MFSNSKILMFFTLLMVIPLSILLGFWMITNPTGSISGVSKFITVSVSLVALINPRLGIYLIIPLCLYSDEIKRLAVIYGSTSHITVYEVLLGPIIALSMLNSGYILGLLTGRFKFSKNWFYGMLVVGIITAGIAFAPNNGSLTERAQSSLNVGLYMTLAPLIGSLLVSREEARNMLKFQMWCALPSIVWGIWQFHNGFSALELAYARTGLSEVHYAQMFNYTDPRPFGFFGSATGYACVGVYGVLALFFAHRAKTPVSSALYLLYFLIVLWAIYAYRGRGLMLTIPLVFVTAFFFYSRIRTAIYYSLVIGTLLLGITFSKKLLYGGGIEKMNQWISSDSDWGQEVLTLNTFSDRLRGWILLSESSTYSAFGNLFDQRVGKIEINSSDADYHHDAITSIVLNTGVVGLSLFLIIGGYALFRIHKRLLSFTDHQHRREASVALACAFVTIATSLTTGNILAVVPINLQLWSIVGMFFVYSRVALNEQRLQASNSGTKSGEEIISPPLPAR